MQPSPRQKLVSNPVEIEALPRPDDCGLDSNDLDPGTDDGPMPSADSLRAARSMLLAEYGPCVACHTETLIATARRLDATC